MKLIHMADLHIGKSVSNYSMIDDQKYILDVILGIIDKEKPDGILIAGDVYDQKTPSVEAVNLFSDFLHKVNSKNVEVFITSGNHDSADRLAFVSGILDDKGVHFAPAYDGTTNKYSLHKGQADETEIHMMPFIKPVHVRVKLGIDGLDNYTEAAKEVVSRMDIDDSKVNILVAHQFVTGTNINDVERCDSETISIGGIDNVDVGTFDAFDYVALGHIHGPQKIIRDTVRYAGSPLKYSLSEERHKKSVTIIEYTGKDNITYRLEELKPLHDMRTLKGTYEELMDKNFYDGTTYTTDYVGIVLTDEEDIPDVMSKLRTVYKNILELRYDNKRTKSCGVVRQLEDIDEIKPGEYFASLYEQQNGQKMTEKQVEIVNGYIEDIWGESK